MPKYQDRQLHHLKSSRTRVGKGAPRPDEGFDGDLALRVTDDGLKLFAKYRNRWYIVGEYMSESSSVPGKGSKGSLPIHPRTRFASNGDVQIERGSQINFDGNRRDVIFGEDNDSGLPTNNRNLRIEANGRALQYWFEDGSATWLTAGSDAQPASFGAQNIIFDYTALASSKHNVQQIGSLLQWKIDSINSLDMTSTGISVGANKRMVLTDNEIETSSGAMTLDSAAGIILDSGDGKFVASNAGVEFSSSNSSYAGMVLGATRIANDSTGIGDDTISMTGTMTVLQTSQGTDVSIAFTAPPSGNVEIVFKCKLFTSSTTVAFALSDSSTFNEVDETHTYDNGVYRMDETDTNTISISWIVTGLTGGTPYTYYIAGEETSGSSSSITHGRRGATGLHSPPITVQAIAMPGTITTGE